MASSTQSLLEALDEPAIIVEGRIVALANESARRLLGASIEGKDVRLAIRNPQALDHIIPGTPGEVDITGIGEFGRPWTLSIQSVDARSLLVRFIDRSAAIAAEKMRVDFVANASHELRTPLATILGYAETLAEEVELETHLCAKFGGIIRNEAKGMLRIIEDLMSLSRIEAGQFVAPTDRVSIGEIAMHAVKRARETAGAGQCKIQLEVQDDLPMLVGDQGQLMQLLDNLLSNAIRYACRSEGCVIGLTAGLDEGWIRLSVVDNGPGIPREHIPKLTARFYRVDTARGRDSGGTGLGLAIVKHIVERHRGTLEIHSGLGEGTEVIVRLPQTLNTVGVTKL